MKYRFKIYYGGFNQLGDNDLPPSLGERFLNSVLPKIKHLQIPFGITIITEKDVPDKDITHVIIPLSVKTIDDSAFQECKNLKEVDIPESVKTIGNFAFYKCSSLTKVTIGESVETIGAYSFFNTNLIGTLNIPDSVKTIGYRAFSGCSSLTKVTIGESVETIGAYSFFNTNLIGTLNIPDSVKTIGFNAFMNCRYLVNVIIGKGVEVIGDRAFYSTNHFRTLYIPKNVKTIGNEAFSNTFLSKVYIEKREDNLSYQHDSFDLDNVTIIDNMLFDNISISIQVLLTKLGKFEEKKRLIVKSNDILGSIYDNYEFTKFDKDFFVKFKDEVGIDAGGLKKEFFTLLSDEIFNIFMKEEDDYYIIKNFIKKRMENIITSIKKNYYLIEIKNKIDKFTNFNKFRSNILQKSYIEDIKDIINNIENSLEENDKITVEDIREFIKNNKSLEENELKELVKNNYELFSNKYPVIIQKLVQKETRNLDVDQLFVIHQIYKYLELNKSNEYLDRSGLSSSSIWWEIIHFPINTLSRKKKGGFDSLIEGNDKIWDIYDEDKNNNLKENDPNIINDVLNKINIDKLYRDYFNFNKDSDDFKIYLSHYNLIGKLFAYAIKVRENINIRLHPILLHYLKNSTNNIFGYKKINNLEDIKNIFKEYGETPETIKNYLNMENYNEEDWNDVSDSFGDKIIPFKDKNKILKDKIIESVYNNNNNLETDSFIEGFHSIIKPTLLNKLSIKTLNLLIAGNDKIDINKFLNNLNIIINNNEQLDLIKNIITEYANNDDTYLNEFLFLATGKKTIPHDGLRSKIILKFTNVENVNSHTCSNTIEFPINYLNDDENDSVESKLRLHLSISMIKFYSKNNTIAGGGNI